MSPPLNPKVQEAVEEVLTLARQGFTGKLVLDYKDGIPQVVTQTKTRRLGKS